jgi:hypothetical protein
VYTNISEEHAAPNPDDGGSMFLRNVRYTTRRVHRTQRKKVKNLSLLLVKPAPVFSKSTSLLVSNGSDVLCGSVKFAMENEQDMKIPTVAIETFV